MKKRIGTLAAVCLVIGGMSFAGSTTATAQDQGAGAAPPPNVLVIIREWLKPGMQGSPHEKSESAFVQTMAQAKSPTHYFAVNSLSGPVRALFFLGYNSFADWGKDVEQMSGNSAIAQQFDQAQQADGKLLKAYDQGVFVYHPQMSHSPNVNVGNAHFWEITIIKVRAGHGDDWKALVKMHDQIYGNMPDTHWAMWEKYYGQDSGSVWIVTTPLKSLAEIDAHRSAAKQARAAAGDQAKQMRTMAASAIESIETNLYAVDPKMSYAADRWKAADPGFWGQQ